MLFETKYELEIQAMEDFACRDGLEFLDRCKDLDECFRTICEPYRLWCMEKSYIQFAEHCDWSKVTGRRLMFLLRSQPQYVNNFQPDWGTLSSSEWTTLLVIQPQFFEHCDFSSFTGYDWLDLLIDQPQFSQYCDWKKLNSYCWGVLLVKHPQFMEYCNWDIVSEIHLHHILKNTDDIHHKQLHYFMEKFKEAKNNP